VTATGIINSINAVVILLSANKILLLAICCVSHASKILLTFAALACSGTALSMRVLPNILCVCIIARSWHLHAWEQAIVYNMQVIRNDPDKVWLRTRQHWQYHIFEAVAKVSDCNCHLDAMPLDCI